MTLAGAVMVCGTASDVGKSRVVAGLCRMYARRGIRVAPFKAQNMALNSYVTEKGEEVARSQAHQAAAAGARLEVAMNPVLLKPTGETRSQLVVMGRPVGEVTADHYGARNEALFATVVTALSDLRCRYDVVVAEGAGGAAEINLLEADLANLRLARCAQMPAILVGDIERGGVFASLYGTVTILPEELRAQLRGFLINKFRGEERLLENGIDEVERRCGMPCLGVLPHLGHLGIDAEDSLALARPAPRGEGTYDGDVLDVAVVALPHLSNCTDFDPFSMEPGVALRYVSRPGEIATADIVVVPGSKATVVDLDWVRGRGFDAAVRSARRDGRSVLGICGGYQMLGTRIVDDVESRAGEVAGLGLLETTTVFSAEKTTRRRQGIDASGTAVSGYEIRHGQPTTADSASPWFYLDDDQGVAAEGVAAESAGIWATSLHGIFENDELRRSFLGAVARRQHKRFLPVEWSFEAFRQAQIDKVADAVETHLDLGRLDVIIGEGGK